MKPRVFWFHYNKPATRSRGRSTLSVHYQKKCHLVDHIECDVPTKTKHRSTQPVVVIAGRGVVRVVEDESGVTAKITAE